MAMRVQGEGRLAVSRGIDRRFRRHEDQPVPRGGAAERGSGVSDRLPASTESRSQRWTPQPATPRSSSRSLRRPSEHSLFAGRWSTCRESARFLSLESTEPAEYVADEHVAETSSHAVTVQPAAGGGNPDLPGDPGCRFAPDGALTETGGSSVPVTGGCDAPWALGLDAALRAARHVAVPDADEEGAMDEFGERSSPRVDLTGFEPRAIASFPNRPDLPTVLEQARSAIRSRRASSGFNRRLRGSGGRSTAMPSTRASIERSSTRTTARSSTAASSCRRLLLGGNVFHQDGGVGVR